jgi:hypothetical protein
MTAVREHRAIDLGVPRAGHIRFLTLTHGDRTQLFPDWMRTEITAYDRTYKEWCDLIMRWRNGGGSEPLTIARSNPFTQRRAAGDALEALLAREMRLRWLARKWIAACRARTWWRWRVMGADADLATCAPIAADSRVSVYDWSSRRIYVFHWNTAIQTIVAALHYMYYGIADPQMPKNPYTNVSWSVSQLTSLVSQAMECVARRGARMPLDVIAFRNAHFDIEKYYDAFRRRLQIAAAVKFFRNHSDRDVIRIYMEIVDDIFMDVASAYPYTHGIQLVRDKLAVRQLDDDYLKRWDQLVIAGWMHTNHNINYYVEGYDDLITRARQLAVDTHIRLLQNLP